MAFFFFLQQLFNFFSNSTSRWKILTDHLSRSDSVLTVKSISSTRWSARDDACHALSKGYVPIKAALEELSEDNRQTPGTRHEANALLTKLSSLEITFMSLVWSQILRRFNSTSKSLQSTQLELSTVVALYESLEKYVSLLRDQFDNFQLEAQKLSVETEYTQRRINHVAKAAYAAGPALLWAPRVVWS